MILNISQLNRDCNYYRLSGKRKLWVNELKQGHLINHLFNRIKWNIAPKDFFNANIPTHFDIETPITYYMCCPMCCRKQTPMNLKQGPIDFSLFIKIIDTCTNRGVHSVKRSLRDVYMSSPKIVQSVQNIKYKGILDKAFLTIWESLSQNTIEEQVHVGKYRLIIHFGGKGNLCP